MRIIIIFLLTLFSLISPIEGISQTKQRVIIDADTGNEVDDPYALARALVEPSWDILALCAAQWQTSHWTEPRSMENSHRLNQLILGEMGLNIKLRRGAVARMYDWGDLAQHSAAAYEIIKQAKATPEGEKLAVIALGALTNVASAVFIDPSIESKIKLYWLGTTYDFDKDILKKNDFNCVMDVQALEVMLMSKVEMNIIPINVASAMTFDFAETKAKLAGKSPMGDFLVHRWYQHLDGGRKSRTIWDLALIEAIVHPDYAQTKTITTSRDNGSRPITYYQSIDVAKMKADFWAEMEKLED